MYVCAPESSKTQEAKTNRTEKKKLASIVEISILLSINDRTGRRKNQ